MTHTEQFRPNSRYRLALNLLSLGIPFLLRDRALPCAAQLLLHTLQLLGRRSPVLHVPVEGRRQAVGAALQAQHLPELALARALRSDEVQPR